jgi:ribosomal protein S18 acetylase RimI-like enzyme
MAAECTVARLTVDDYEAVRDLWEQSGLPIKPGGRDSREQFSRQLSGGMQTVIGAWQGEQLVGVVVATHDARKGWINRLAIHPNFRRRGLGRRLITEAEDVLHAQGMQIIAALIEDGNEPSLELFRQAGYSEHADIHYMTKRHSQDV